MVLMRCVCHSLALCIQKAFEKMPSSIGYLLAEIPRWFCKSPLGRHDYSQLFQGLS